MKIKEIKDHLEVKLQLLRKDHKLINK